MSRSTFARVAAAATLLASTASAANVAMYWGQGSNQLDLSEVCADPSIEIVNIAFVNGFPQKVGDYPATNFANACGGDYYEHPTDPSQNNKLLSNCPGIGPGIDLCHQNGKKVLLSLGGGYPTNYYLPDPQTAAYFAKFLVSAFGKPNPSWTGPRPFGSAYVDGFDLDLEADASEVPDPKYISANYAYFVNQLKSIQKSLLISSAPQCQVPDVRLSDAIKNAPFDYIFTQFYNTAECSARTGYDELKAGGKAFTFDKWVTELKGSMNKGVKLYMGLAAGPDGLPTNKNDYLTPEEADTMITKYKSNSMFGGVMLWEATVSARNKVNCQTYSTWVKSSLDGTFKNKYSKGCAVSSSSSVRPSSTKASSTKASSSIASSTKASSSIASSTKASSSIASSTKASSSVASSTKASSSMASSTIVPSSTIASSTVVSTTSAAVSPTATVTSQDGTCGDQKNGLVFTCKGYNFGGCCSQYGYCGGYDATVRELYCGAGCNPILGECDSVSSSVVSSTSASASASASSSAVSSSVQATSSVASSSASSSAVVSSSASSSAVVSSSAASSVVVSSTAASSSVAASSSSVAASSSAASSVVIPTSTASSSIAASSSAASSAASSVASSSSGPHSSGSIIYSPYPTGTGVSTSVYPTIVSSSASVHGYGNFSASVNYPVPAYTPSASVPVYDDAKSTPCTTSSVKVASSTPGYPVYQPSQSAPGYPVYQPSQSAPSYPVYQPSQSAPSYPVYQPSQSAPGYPIYEAPASSSVKAYEYPPSVTSKPVDNYPAYPPSSPTTKIVTTTYVDSCETGITTKTETMTVTVCNKCKDDSVTSVYVCNNCGPTVVTYTITKPASPPTHVPSVPAKPSSPSYGGGDKPQPPAKPSNPVYAADVPKKQEAPVSTTVTIVYVTKTPVPVLPSVMYTPIPYPSAPAKNGTSGYPVKPTGTGVVVPSKPTGYTPPQFTGAASRVGAAGSVVAALAAAAGMFVL
ncbi:glycoside hydrolase superfamily [Phaeosphaeriaceae sp. PMI808]|nr:glycoside hydrolase superfamily [Phaeosphaeriaceae sp. PMI808]